MREFIVRQTDLSVLGKPIQKKIIPGKQSCSVIVSTIYIKDGSNLFLHQYVGFSDFNVLKRIKFCLEIVSPCVYKKVYNQYEYKVLFKGPDHLQKNLFLKNHKSFAMPKKISKT